jgi:hypothetical protein
MLVSLSGIEGGIKNNCVKLSVSVAVSKGGHITLGVEIRHFAVDVVAYHF